MRITRLAWHNFKGLNDGSIHADGNDVIIRGQNGAGKSSIAEIVPFVLFGKISGDIKRYNDGLTLDDVGTTHSAAVTFDNGLTLERQVVSKEGGSDYLYLRNGNKLSATDFKAEVAQITKSGDEYVLNPFAFFDGKKLKSIDERRKFLLKTFPNLYHFTDDERELLNGKSPQKFLEDAKRNLKAMKGDLPKVTARIDELAHQIADNNDDFDSQVNQLNLQINAANSKRDQLQSAHNFQADYVAAQAKVNAAQAKVDRVQFQVDSLSKQVLDFRAQYRELAEQYNLNNDTKPGLCPTCGQPIPQKIFDETRKSRADKIVTQLNNVNANGQDAAKKLKAVQEELAQALAELDHAKKIADELKQKADAHQQIQTQRDAELKSVNDTIDALNQELSAIKAKAKNVADLRARCAQLNEQAKTLGRDITALEGNIACAKNILQRQVESVSDDINSHFQFIKFKLFDFNLKNGECKPACEPMLHGVPFSALSKGEQLKCALDLFNALQNIYGVELPLLIDDAESYTLNSFITLSNQVWLFKVSDDPELVIEVKKARLTA